MKFFKRFLLISLLCQGPIYCSSDFNFSGRSNIIRLQSGSNFIVGTELTGFNGKLIKDPNATISGSNITFDQGSIEDNGNKFSLNCQFNPGSNQVVLDGEKTFKGKRGNILSSLNVSGLNNRLEGQIQINSDIELQDQNTSVTCVVQGCVPCNFVLNGGTLFLEEDLKFVDDKFFSGSGVLKLNKRKLRLGSRELTCSSPLYFDEAQDIELNSNFHLAETWTFSGESVIEGHGKILDFADAGEIVIERGSSLLMRGLVLENVSENNIKCLDCCSTLSLQNVTWIQSGNYSFTIGAIEVVDKLCLKGNSTFAYQSAQTSTVWANGKIVVDRGMTFSFDPIYNSNYSLTHDIAGTAINRWDWARDFLCFEDGTAALELKGSTLHVTSTGLKIKKGTFRVREKSYITSELDGDFHIEEGFILGNNSSSDDARCEIDGGAILEVTSGAFSYKNMQSTSWLMFNDQSKLSIANGGKLKLHQTLDVGDGIASFADGGRLARASGKSLEGSVHILGSVYYEICYN